MRARAFVNPLVFAVAGACVLAIVMGIGRFAYTPMLPPMLAEGGLNLTSAGAIASANFLGYLVGALLASRSWFRRHRVSGLRAAIVASVLTTAAMAWLHDSTSWAALRFLSGVASAFALVYTSGMILEVVAATSRPMLGSLLYAGVGIGIALSAVVVYAGRGNGLGADALWLALGAVAAVLAVLPLRQLDQPAPQASTSSSTRATAAPVTAAPPIAATSTAAPATAIQIDERNAQALWLLILGYGCLGFGYVITATFIVVMARSMPDAATWEFWSWMVVGLAGAPSNAAWQLVANRWNAYRAIVAAFLVAATGVILAAVATGPGGLLVGAAFLGATFMAITALGLAVARTLSPQAPDQSIARMTAAFGAGQIIGPSVGGWMAERSGDFLAASWLAAAVLVVGAGLTAAAGLRASSIPAARQ